MIDENLPSKNLKPPGLKPLAPTSSVFRLTPDPAFFLKNNSNQPQISTIYHRQHGNDPEPAYSLRALDPASPSSQNRYGVALYDPYVTDVVYGEVAVIPEWTQPSLSADTIRANGGTAPPPEPILPNEFTIQLYNPDQTIKVKYNTKSWNKPARWEFEMPQNTFRVPSGSTLDQGQIDPSIADITPKLRFSWRKDGKLSKDLTCLLHGKTSTIPDTRTKSREPDITVALFQGLKELTLYEPNLYRVEMEDFKGLEVVLLLAAVAIRDIFFGPAKEAFHISNNSPQISRKPAAVPTAAAATPVASAKLDRQTPQAGPSGTAINGKPSPPRLNIPNTTSPGPQERRLQDELAKREEERRNQEILAAEKEQRRRDAEVDKETKRLQKLYGREEEQARRQNHTPAPSSRPHLPPRHSGPPQPYSHQYSQSSVQLSQGPPRHYRQQQPQLQPHVQFQNNPYQAPGRMDPRTQSFAHLQARPQSRVQQPRPQSTVSFYAQPTSSGALPASKPPQIQPKKSGFFGFRRNKEESAASKLEKKRSSMF
ncbi:uncharacterized protein N7529_010381 [Penicillium soppii]|uniref:uncharacterized protein n=1 Tax=Penicillium soppii TaxID=69789 RepID=UPI0025479216|nr:uncharacterized protein N7529_010381 [Penicillium soppii]KAJ5856437.1 hypothetical protein N7529_010381 [Penicillium soppii]